MEPAHLLIVEDSEVTRFKLKATLARLGYNVTAHSGPVSALEWLDKSGITPDLIMTDVIMPEMNGFDFIRKVRSRPATANTPIIVLTDHADVESRIAGLQAGADDHLAKTATSTELELRLKALLARAHADEGAVTQAAARTITVFSLRGGVGTTSIAVNLAIALAQLRGIAVCLWDMSLSGGHCASLLNLRPTHTPVSLHNWPDATVEDETMATLLIKHESGIALMPAPLSAAEADLVDSFTIDLIWPYILNRYSYLVVDAGNHFTDTALAILQRSDMILLVLAPDMASMKCTSDALRIFEKMGIDRQRIILVVNNIFPSQQSPFKKIVAALGNGKAMEIPYDSGSFVQAFLTGQPVITADSRSKASQSIRALAQQLSSDAMESQ